MKLLLVVIFMLSMFCANAQSDSLYPSWINKEYNNIYFNDSSYLKNTVRLLGEKEKSFTVLHIGDSHLQNENLPNQARKLLQSIQGDAGIGLVVPFSTVKSYDARFYKSTHTGVWHNSKSYMGKFDYPMGVRGMTSYTNDVNATFNIAFNQPVSSANNELIVFRSDNDSVFDAQFFIDGKEAILKYADNEKLIFNVFGDFSYLTFKSNRSNEKQKDITITGLLLQDSLKRGGIWNNAGVGAAPYCMVLREEYYETQAKFINPDLVIIDLGTNDFLYYNRIETNLRSQIVSVIEKVKQASPNADIILTDAQEMKYKGKRTTVARDFSAMMYELANEFHCGFWSYYHVSGEENAWRFWDAAKFTQGDGIHLNGKGSELKGTLLFDAIVNSITKIRNEKVASFKLNVVTDTINLVDSVSAPIDLEIVDSISITTNKQELKLKHEVKSSSKKTVPLIYIVRKGDTLSEIAWKTKVPIAKIRKLNHLTSDKIKPGQKLKLK